MGLTIDYANTILAVSRLVSSACAVACGFIVDRSGLRRIMFFLPGRHFGLLPFSLGLSSVSTHGCLSFFQAFFRDGVLPGRACGHRKNVPEGDAWSGTGIILSTSFFMGGRRQPGFSGFRG
jgi:hypothetical protein